MATISFEEFDRLMQRWHEEHTKLNFDGTPDATYSWQACRKEPCREAQGIVRRVDSPGRSSRR